MDNKMCGQKTTKIDVESVIEAQNSPKKDLSLLARMFFYNGTNQEKMRRGSNETDRSTQRGTSRR